jgi:hypothetical protein
VNDRFRVTRPRYGIFDGLPIDGRRGVKAAAIAVTACRSEYRRRTGDTAFVFKFRDEIR